MSGQYPIESSNTPSLSYVKEKCLQTLSHVPQEAAKGDSPLFENHQFYLYILTAYILEKYIVLFSNLHKWCGIYIFSILFGLFVVMLLCFNHECKYSLSLKVLYIGWPLDCIRMTFYLSVDGHVSCCQFCHIKTIPGGACVAQSVECPNLDFSSGLNLTAVSSSPVLDSTLGMEPI